MKQRAGFTLVEVMTAIAISGMVALLSFSVARAGFDTEARIDDDQTAQYAEVRLRAVLYNALRHPAASGGAAMNDTLFAIDENGVRFVASDARVELTLEDSAMVLTLRPFERAQPLVIRVPGVNGIAVGVLDRTTNTRWQRSWPVAGRFPAAVRIDFESARPMPPVIAHTALEVQQ